MSKVDLEGALGEFFSECEEILQRVTSVLTKLESHELTSETIDSLYRDVHTLKGTSQLFGFQRIGLIAHAIEASLEPVRQNKVKLDRQFVDLIFKSLDVIDKILKNPKLDLENDPFLQNELMYILPRMIEASNKRFGGEFQLDHSLIPSEQIGADTLGSISQQDLNETIHRSGGNIVEAHLDDRSHQGVTKLKIEKNNPGEEQQLESSTIRIQVSLLDKLMNLVGEMVLARNQVLQFARTSDNNEFLNLTQLILTRHEFFLSFFHSFVQSDYLL
jgi:two-component system chemotaxis sensor kinase CheA